MTTETRVSDIEYNLYHACEEFVAAFPQYCNSVRCECCLFPPKDKIEIDCPLEKATEWMINFVSQIDYKRADNYGVKIGFESGSCEFPKGRWRTTKEIPFQAICEIYDCCDADIKVIPYFD